MRVFLLLLASTFVSVACSLPSNGTIESIRINIFPSDGYNMKSYESLREKIETSLYKSTSIQEKEDLQAVRLCVAHGTTGLTRLLIQVNNGKNQDACQHGIVVLGAIPKNETDHEIMRNNDMKVLFLAGDLDGVLRFSNFAAAKHQYEGRN